MNPIPKGLPGPMISAAANITKHLDHELHWIVDETVSNLFAAERPKPLTRGELCKTVGKAVGETLIDRLGGETGLAIEEFEKLGLDSIMAMDKETLESGSLVVSRYVAEACVVYAQGRLMGMKSPYKTPPRNPNADYWPFGQEGGFCNPMKLKMLGDD